MIPLINPFSNWDSRPKCCAGAVWCWYKWLSFDLEKSSTGRHNPLSFITFLFIYLRIEVLFSSHSFCSLLLSLVLSLSNWCSVAHTVVICSQTIFSALHLASSSITTPLRLDHLINTSPSMPFKSFWENMERSPGSLRIISTGNSINAEHGESWSCAVDSSEGWNRVSAFLWVFIIFWKVIPKLTHFYQSRAPPQEETTLSRSSTPPPANDPNQPMRSIEDEPTVTPDAISNESHEIVVISDDSDTDQANDDEEWSDSDTVANPNDDDHNDDDNDDEYENEQSSGMEQDSLAQELYNGIAPNSPTCDDQVVVSFEVWESPARRVMTRSRSRATQ